MFSALFGKKPFSTKFSTSARKRVYGRINAALNSQSNPKRALEHAIGCFIITKDSRAEQVIRSFPHFKKLTINREEELAIDFWLISSIVSAELENYPEYNQLELMTNAFEIVFEHISYETDVTTESKKQVYQKYAELIDFTRVGLKDEKDYDEAIIATLLKRLYGISSSKNFIIKSSAQIVYSLPQPALNDGIRNALRLVNASADLLKNTDHHIHDVESALPNASLETSPTKPVSIIKSNGARKDDLQVFRNYFDSIGRRMIYDDLAREMESAKEHSVMLNLSLAVFVVHNESRAELVKQKLGIEFANLTVDREFELAFDFWLVYAAAAPKLSKYPTLYSSPNTLIDSFCYAMDVISKRFALSDVEKPSILEKFGEISECDVKSVEKWVELMADKIFSVTGPSHTQLTSAILNVYVTSIKCINDAIDELCLSIINDKCD